MKDDKEFIKGIYDKYDEYLKDSNNEKLKNKKSQVLYEIFCDYRLSDD